MELSINGKSYTVNGDPEEFLVWVLRDELGLTGTKFGCGAGICGSCTVMVGNAPVRSCITPAIALVGQAITTIEGISTTLPSGETKLHPVQQAFIDEQTPQCAWCMSGQMMTALAFLKTNPNPTAEDIETAMSNNYCRCGCYVRIRSAVARAAELMKTESSATIDKSAKSASKSIAINTSKSSVKKDSSLNATTTA
jgi:isoquinoline 1-oxidoreductase subunit alpha